MWFNPRHDMRENHTTSQPPPPPARGHTPRLPTLIRPRVALCLILLVTATLRLLSFVQMQNSPCLWLHRNGQTDMGFFDSWAREIAHGDLLCNRAIHPHHVWHASAAHAQLTAYPDYMSAPHRRTAGSASDGNDAARALWDYWYGGKRFHQEPLYPYLIACCYSLITDDHRIVLILQVILGICNVALVYAIGRRMFGELPGLVAAALAALCGPLVFYESVLLRATLISFAALGLTYLFTTAPGKKSAPFLVAAGFAAGLTVLLKSVFVLFLAGAFCSIIILHRRRPIALLRPVLLSACGLFLALAPAVARNLIVGVAPFSFSSVPAVSFITSNAGDYDPRKGVYISAHTPRIMGETQGSFLPTVIETLKTHSGAASYLKQLAGKFASMWHWYEKPNNVNFYYARLHVGVLRYLPVTFALIGPLGLLGMLLGIRSMTVSWPLYLMTMCFMGIMLITHVLSRYRIPLAALLLPFAGLALVRTAQYAANRQFMRLGLCSASLVLSAAWTLRPLPDGIPLIRTTDYASAYTAYYSVRALNAIERGDWNVAAAVMESSLAVEPELVKQLYASRRPADAEEASLAALYAQIHDRLAEALRNCGRPDAARKHTHRAEALNASLSR